MDEADAIDVVLQMVRALEHAQKYKIVHRDIKPENILITKSGTAKLCDLGLAKPIIEGGAADSEGRPMGTALYVAPEQIRQSAQLGFPADIYSLGCTLYHALTGQPPFTGASAKEIVKKHLGAPVPNPRDKVLEISTGTASVVMKMMAKDPNDRYQALQLLDEDLDACLDGRPPVNTITIGRKAAPLSQDAIDEMASSGTRRGAAGGVGKKGKGPIIAAVVILLGVVGGIAAMMGKKDPPPPPPPPPVVTKTGGGKASVRQDAMKEAREKAATEALGAVEMIVAEHGEDSDASLEALRKVATEHSDTESGASARERVVNIETARRTRREKEYGERLARSSGALSEGRLGEAVASWAELPSDWSGTDFETKATEERTRIEGIATKRLEAANVLAQSVIDGDEENLEKARQALAVLADSGLAAVAKDAAATLKSMEDSLRERRELAEAARAAWTRVLPEAVLAASGGIEASRSVLRREAKVLAPVQADVDLLYTMLDDLGVFLEAIPRGWAVVAAEGEAVRLRVAGRPGGVIKGRAKGGGGERIEVQRGPAVESVKLSEVHPEDRAKLAWRELGAGSVRHHRGAVLFFLANGSFSGANTEIKALEVMGNGENLDAVRRLYGAVQATARARADTALKEAEVLLLQRRTEAAREAFARAVAACEGYPKTLWKQAAFAMEHGSKGEDVRALLEQAVALGPEDADAWYHVGEARRKDKELELALEAYEEFLGKAAPDAPLRDAAMVSLEEVRAAAVAASSKAARTAAAKAYRKENFKVAENEWRRVLKYLPKDVEATYFLGKTLLARENWVDGYLQLRRFLTLGGSGSRSRDAKNIIKDMERRLADSPEASRKHTQGVKYHNQRQYREAIEMYGEALFLAPLREATYVDRGNAYHLSYLKEGRKEDLTAAAQDLEIALSMNDRNGNAWDKLAVVYFTQGKWSETVRAARVAIERNPLSANSCNVMARACNELKKYAQAEEAASEGIKREPSATLFIARGAARLGMGELKGAREDLDHAA
ncbi:MAG: protein kinase domain-containing protein, partial [Planctomycetota bacterium]